MAELALIVSVGHESYADGAARYAALSPRLRKAWRDATVEATRATRESVEETVRRRTGMDPGTVRAMTTSEEGTDGGDSSWGRVSLTTPPARFYPRTASALSFVVGGRRVFAKSVRGSRPYKLVGRGADAADGARERIYRDAVERIEP